MVPSKPLKNRMLSLLSVSEREHVAFRCCWIINTTAVGFCPVSTATFESPLLAGICHEVQLMKINLHALADPLLMPAFLGITRLNTA